MAAAVDAEWRYGLRKTHHPPFRQSLRKRGWCVRWEGARRQWMMTIVAPNP